MRYFVNLLLLSAILSGQVTAQTNRINTKNTIGWYNYFGTIRLSNPVSLHTEYQWRRSNLITDWQQSLLRVGINYQVSPTMLFRVGYAWVETFPYGEIPQNIYGKDVTEHRIFQMMQLAHKESRVTFSHRFMLEQRWLGKYSAPQLTREDGFVFLNRFRYMYKTQFSLMSPTRQSTSPYLALYDEILIGFGKNVSVNIFDQNRLGGILGYRITPMITIEAGYINQIIQYGRQINGQSVFQYNRGVIMNANFTFDWRKKSSTNKQ